MFKFSQRSLDRLHTCDERLQSIFNVAIKASPVDFGIDCGHRTLKRQQELYANEKSKCDGIIKISNHQRFPSKAIDIYPYINGTHSYDKNHLCLFAGVIYAIAFELGIKIRWGGTFGSKDFHGWDYPHFELIED